MSPHHHRLEEAGKGLQDKSALEHLVSFPNDKQTGRQVFFWEWFGS